MERDLDISQNLNVVRAIKRPVPVLVRFAETDGVCETPEGTVHFRQGDAIAEGAHDDTWPIQRHKFLERYEPVPPTRPGEAGEYVKRALPVYALSLTEPVAVPVGWQSDPLYANPGDWLIQYGPDDFGVVKPEIFEATYEILSEQEK